MCASGRRSGYLHIARTQKSPWEHSRWGSLQGAKRCMEALWTCKRLWLPSGHLLVAVGLVVPRGWGGLNLFVFLPQKRQKEKTPHVDVGAAQQPPVCVYRSACLGVALCVGMGPMCFCPSRGQSDTKCKCQCVLWCVGVYACFLHICECAPSAPFSVLLSVCLKYVTVCCLLLCLACEWARVHIGN